MSQPMTGLVTGACALSRRLRPPERRAPDAEVIPHRLDEQAEVERPHRHADRARRGHDGDDYPAVEETALTGVPEDRSSAVHLPNTVVEDSRAILTPAYERHLGRHDAHELDVGVKRQIRDVHDGIRHVLNVHRRLG